MRNYTRQNDEPSRTDVNGDWNPLKETMSNFDGLELSDDNSFAFVESEKDFYNAVDPVTAGIQTAGKVAEASGKIAEAEAKKKEAQAKIIEIGGKRQAQLKQCEENKAFKKFADAKYRRNRITECQAQVTKRLDAEELEQQDIIRKNVAIEQGRVSNDGVKSASLKSESSTKKYAFIIGGVLLAVFIGYKMFKKK
jgi:hypothetical protein